MLPPIETISGIARIGGSRHTDSSDIDVLVDFREDADLFDWTALAAYLEEQTGRKVDVVPKHVLRSELCRSVLAEAIVL